MCSFCFIIIITSQNPEEPIKSKEDKRFKDMKKSPVSLKIGNLMNIAIYLTRKIGEVHLFTKHYSFYFKILFNVILNFQKATVIVYNWVLNEVWKEL